MESFSQLLDAVKEYCRTSMSDTAYNVWISGLEPVSFSGDSAVISASSEFVKDAVTKRYLSKLKEGFENVIGYDIDLTIIAREESSEEEKATDSQTKPQSRELSYTFDNFIIGPENRMANAAALAVAKDPSNAFNPLFIYGASGLGKTHLLLAIKNYLSKSRPELNVIYISCETFTNELIASILRGNTDSFHDKYRNVDVLLMDDIQFIGGKESTQTEFFYTFEALFSNEKQIVLTSDRPPREIQTLEERLRTRFEWGLIADVKPPDVETRKAIVFSKAEELNLKINSEIAEFIASQLKSNVRQIEGVITKLHAFNLLDGTVPSLETVQKAVQDVVNETIPFNDTVAKIITEVARTYNVTEEDLKGKKQRADVSTARQIAMYIIREITDSTMEKIGDVFDKNHATVVYSVNKVNTLIETDPKIRAIVNDIIKNCQQ